MRPLAPSAISARVVHAYVQAAARECERASTPVIPAPMIATSTLLELFRLDGARRLVEPEWRVHVADATRAGR